MKSSPPGPKPRSKSAPTGWLQGTKAQSGRLPDEASTLREEWAPPTVGGGCLGPHARWWGWWCPRRSATTHSSRRCAPTAIPPNVALVEFVANWVRAVVAPRGCRNRGEPLWNPALLKGKLIQKACIIENPEKKRNWLKNPKKDSSNKLPWKSYLKKNDKEKQKINHILMTDNLSSIWWPTTKIEGCAKTAWMSRTDAHHR